MVRVIGLGVLWACAACAGPTGTGLRRGPWAAAPIAESEAAASASLDDPLPVAPELHRGVLPNGVHYYVKKNSTPEARAVLRLVVDAGSVLEDDDQQGLAHVVEHMAFNGTTRYPGTSLVSYLESIGMQFGAHVNAATGFDSTIFDVVVPTDETKVIDEGLGVLREWATEITFAPEEIDKERGVVLEEWRRSRGASGRTRDRTRPLTFAGSRYAERAPIGTEESLRNFDRAALMRFYRDWYRPDLMAVVAVGDFEPEAMVAAIEKLFGDITPPENPRPRLRPAVPTPSEAAVGVFADPEITRATVAMMTKLADLEGGTHGDYRDAMVEQLAVSVVNERLHEVTRQQGVPLLAAMVGKTRLTPTTSAFIVHGAVPEAEVIEGLDTLLEALETFRRYGVDVAALDRAKRRLRAFLENAFAERDTLASRGLADELVRAFLHGEAVPGLPYEHALTMRFTDEVSEHDVHAWLSEVLGRNDGRVLTVVQPQRAGSPLLAETDVRQRLLQARSRAIAGPNRGGDEDASLMSGVSLPPAGTVTSEVTLDDVGVTEWRLSNGIRVLLKPTDFKADQVLLQASAWGGFGGADADTFRSAEMAPAIATASGVGAHDAATLSRLMAGRQAGLSMWVAEQRRGLSGQSTKGELETLLQLAHLRLTAPRFDDDAFARQKKKRTEQVKNREATPHSALQDARTELLWANHPRRLPWSEAAIETVKLEAARTFYEKHLTRPEGLVVTLVGALEPASVRPLVLRYLGSVPPGPSTEAAATGAPPERQAGELSTTVHKGIDPKARVSITFHGPFDGTPQARHTLRSLASVLERLLREELREERGGTYSARVYTKLGAKPHWQYEVHVSFGCAPERVSELTEATSAIIDSLRKTPVEVKVVADLQEQQRRAHEERVRDNHYWAGALGATVLWGEDPSELLKYTDRVDALSPEVVRAAAERYLDDARSVTVTLLPEEARGQMVDAHTAQRRYWGLSAPIVDPF